MPYRLGKRHAAREDKRVHSLPIFVRLAGQPVILIGDGEAADAKRRLLERAGAVILGEAGPAARLAIVALEDEDEAMAAVVRLRARGILTNAVDRPRLSDFTMPAIVDRDPVLIAIATGGASAGLAAALRQRLEMLLPPSLGRLAEGLRAARTALRHRWPEAGNRRRAIASLLAPGAALDPLAAPGSVDDAIASADAEVAHSIERIAIRSHDPDELTLRAARLLALADRVYHPPELPSAILDRARADAARIVGSAPALALPGLSIELR